MSICDRVALSGGFKPFAVMDPEIIVDEMGNPITMATRGRPEFSNPGASQMVQTWSIDHHLASENSASSQAYMAALETRARQELAMALAERLRDGQPVEVRLLPIETRYNPSRAVFESFLTAEVQPVRHESNWSWVDPIVSFGEPGEASVAQVPQKPLAPIKARLRPVVEPIPEELADLTPEKVEEAFAAVNSMRPEPPNASNRL